MEMSRFFAFDFNTPALGLIIQESMFPRIPTTQKITIMAEKLYKQNFIAFESSMEAKRDLYVMDFLIPNNFLKSALNSEFKNRITFFKNFGQHY